jgi:hypothetical protein
VVHDLDMKDGKHGVPECAAVRRVVDGLRQLYRDDNALLAQGIVVMEALHRSFAAEHLNRQPKGRSTRQRSTSRRRL